MKPHIIHMNAKSILSALLLTGSLLTGCGTDSGHTTIARSISASAADVAGAVPGVSREADSHAEEDQDEERDLGREEDEADLDLLAVEEDDEDRVDREHAEDHELPRRVFLGRALHVSILCGVAHRDRRKRARYESWLARRGQSARGRRSKRGTGDVSRERTQPFTPEVAVVAGDLCSLLRRHLWEVAPRRPASILVTRSEGDNPPLDEIARNLRLLPRGAKYLQSQHFTSDVVKRRNAC